MKKIVLVIESVIILNQLNMITLNQFINKYEGKSLCNDYWCQCVKLVKVFAEEVLGETIWYFWSAIEWYKNWHNTFPSSKWYKEDNTPSWVPAVWSLIFFYWKNFSEFWHVWVVVRASVNSVTILEQNWQTGNGTGTWADAIRLQEYWYEGVVGWMTHDTIEEELTFHEAIEEYSQRHIVVLYKWKYYINLLNNRTEVTEFNFKETLWLK